MSSVINKCNGFLSLSVPRELVTLSKESSKIYGELNTYKLIRLKS